MQVRSRDCNIYKTTTRSLSFREKTNYRNSIKNAKHRAEAILDQFTKVIDETLIQAEGPVSRRAVTIPHTSLAAIISPVLQFVRTGGDNFPRNANIKNTGSLGLPKGLVRGFLWPLLTERLIIADGRLGGDCHSVHVHYF